MPRTVAPRHLTPRSSRIYRTVVDEYELADEPHALEILRLALEALDRADRPAQPSPNTDSPMRIGSEHPVCALRWPWNVTRGSRLPGS